MINGEGGPWLAPGDNIQTRQYHGGLEMTKVLVADDDPLTMAGITALLDKSNFDLVATVNTGAAVLDTLASARPGIGRAHVGTHVTNAAIAHRHLHVLTHSFPSLRSSVLCAADRLL